MSAEREQMPNHVPLEEREEEMRETGPEVDVAGEEVVAGDAMAGTELPDTERPGTGTPGSGSRRPLLPGDRSDSYRERWEQIQVKFVDEPQTAVEEADRLVLDVIQVLQSSFTVEREALEEQWQRGSEVETEQLRVALQRYRSFFDRLLTA